MDQLIERISGAIRTGTCVPIVGAGVSIPTGGPDWTGYLKKLCDGLPDPFHSMVNVAADPTEVATVLLAKRRELGLREIELSVLPGALHKALAAWRCPLYLTTNFDKALEQALHEQWEGCKVYSASELKKFDLNAHMTADVREKPAVIKLCTSQNHSVLTKEAFAELMHGNSGVLTLLEGVLRSYCVVFVGCGIGDPLLNTALDRCFASPMGFPHPIAIMPDNISQPRRAALEVRNTQILSYDSKEKTSGLQKILTECATVATGSQRLLIFEPGSMTKLTPVLQGISAHGRDLGISNVGIVTASEELAQELVAWGGRQEPRMTVHKFVVPNVHATDEVSSAVLNGPWPIAWTSMVAPFELAVEAAAAFANSHRVATGRGFRFHSPDVAALSRNKDKFREFLKNRYDDHPNLARHAFDKLEIPQGATAKELLDLVRQCAAASGKSVVVKPCNAAGSRGVRPLNLSEEPDSLNQLTDFLRVMRLLNVNPETMLCDSSSILVEERLDGEEFSVEGRSSGDRDPVETLAIHWKVDIDADKTRYFERLFVTFPPDTFDLATTLSEANSQLLKDMNVGAGVFHSEYRVFRDGKKVVPLEVGLRPGGGMVNNSVFASCGVDLFESSIQCAMGQRASAVGRRRVVATGLVFATTNDGGVIPPLKFFDDENGARAVIHGETESLRSRLRRLVATADRKKALDALKRVLNRKNEICESVVNAFSPDGAGLQADVDLVEMWMKPGEFILDEEASYVAGLRVVASKKLEARAAMAEAVAAMELCLSRLKCTPEAPLRPFNWKTLHSKVQQPEWWTKHADSAFRSDVDSLTFFHGMLRDERDMLRSVLDLGCGSAKPAIPLVNKGARYLGVDVDENAVKVAKGNLANVEGPDGRRPDAEVIRADVLKTNWADHPAFSAVQWEAVACNLPYLACPPDSTLPISVDGGHDGLRFVPRIPIAAAKALGIRKVIINISSLSNLEEFARRVEDEGYGVTRAVATIAKLEKYSQQVLDYLRDQPFIKLFGTSRHPRQVIYCFTLEPGAGIACNTTIEDIRRAISPDVNSEGTMVDGSSCW